MVRTHEMSEEEREICRQVMKVRGEEMYRHLCPRHLWRPYSSHANRALIRVYWRLGLNSPQYS